VEKDAAVGIRKPEVEHDRVVGIDPDEVPRLRYRARRVDRPGGLAEAALEALRQPVLVFDDQRAHEAGESRGGTIGMPKIAGTVSTRRDTWEAVPIAHNAPRPPVTARASVPRD